MEINGTERQALLRQIPAVEELFKTEELQQLLSLYPRLLVLTEAREVTAAYRKKILQGELKVPPEKKALAKEIAALLKEKSSPSLRPVINATGIILHTNLGRALLSPSALAALQTAGRSYINLEFNLTTGKRGSRYEHVEALLKLLTGAEAALVVNNNAAAVLLVLSTLARGKEVVVSRGELVEIGGSFRIPEIIAAGGARLVEVGTTNKTYLRDYEKALSPETAALLKVHPSNYRILGFTQAVPLAELVQLGNQHGLPAVADLGSGLLVDLTPWGLKDEPVVSSCVAAGTDIITFSGDKLLGGPQAGIILGKKVYLEKLKANPLTRALRIDKLTLAALEATLREYLNPEKALSNIPTLHFLTKPEEVLKNQAHHLARHLRRTLGEKAEVNLEKGTTSAGGGALPSAVLPAWLVTVTPRRLPAGEVAARLRQGNPPVLVRIEENRLLADLRTVAEAEIPFLIGALKAALNF